MQSGVGKQFFKNILQINLGQNRDFTADGHSYSCNMPIRRTAAYFFENKNNNGAGIAVIVNWVRQDLRNTDMR